MSNAQNKIEQLIAEFGRYEEEGAALETEIKALGSKLREVHSKTRHARDELIVANRERLEELVKIGIDEQIAAMDEAEFAAFANTLLNSEQTKSWVEKIDPKEYKNYLHGVYVVAIRDKMYKEIRKKFHPWEPGYTNGGVAVFRTPEGTLIACRFKAITGF